MLIKLNRLAGLVGRVSFMLLWALSARRGPAPARFVSFFPRNDSKEEEKKIKWNEKEHARTSTKRWNQIMFLCQFRSRRLTASSTQPNTNAFIARSPPHLVPFFTASFFSVECAISLAQQYRLRTLLNWLIYFIFFYLRLCRLSSTLLLLLMSLPFHFEFRNSMPDGNRQSCHIIIVASDECQSIFNEIQGASFREVNPRLLFILFLGNARFISQVQTMLLRMPGLWCIHSSHHPY